MRTEGRASMARCGWAASRPLVGQRFSGGGLDPARQLCFARRTADTPARAPPRDLRALVHPAFSKLVSILTGLVRRVSEAANRAATPQPNPGEDNAFHTHGHGNEGIGSGRSAKARSVCR